MSKEKFERKQKILMKILSQGQNFTNWILVSFYLFICFVILSCSDMRFIHKIQEEKIIILIKDK